MYQTVVEKIETYILCSIIFITPAVYEMWKVLYSGGGHRWQYGVSALHTE